MTDLSFLSLLNTKAQDVIFHRDSSITTPCPCQTPEGYRDPVWHTDHPGEPFCNPSGMLVDPDSVVELGVKAFMQPIQSTRATRLQDERILAMFNEIQSDDHLGVFPIEWAGQVLNFRNWGRAGEDWIEFDDQRFTVVNVNRLFDGDGPHHTEVALRLIESTHG